MHPKDGLRNAGPRTFPQQYSLMYPYMVQPRYSLRSLSPFWFRSPICSSSVQPSRIDLGRTAERPQSLNSLYYLLIELASSLNHECFRELLQLWVTDWSPWKRSLCSGAISSSAMCFFLFFSHASISSSGKWGDACKHFSPLFFSELPWLSSHCAVIRIFTYQI